MKKFMIVFLFLSLLMLNSSFANQNLKETTVLSGSVTKLPLEFFGTWRVVSKIIETNSPLTFRKNGLDLWNLSQVGNVIKLSNPFNGASAEITVEKESENHIVFKKKGTYDGKVVTDTVEINISGENFEGYDNLVLETLSDVDGSKIKTETAKYKITGERIFSTED